MAIYYETLMDELKVRIALLNKQLLESLEEERRCKDNYDFEGFAEAYQKSKKIIDESHTLEYKLNFIEKNMNV